MKEKIKIFVDENVSMLGITIFFAIIGTFCLVYFGEKYYLQFEEIYRKSDFKIYVLSVLAFFWLCFFVWYQRVEFKNFVKFVLEENILIRKDLSKLNKNTRKLIINHSHKEFYSENENKDEVVS